MMARRRDDAMNGSEARVRNIGRASRVRARGVTPLEAAVAFAIGGSLLAVAVPAFVRELHASRFAEPVNGLERLSAAALAYANDRPPSDAFPPSAPLTPPSPPRGTLLADPAGAWEHPSWQALGFRAVKDGETHAFAFGFDSARAPGRATFVAHAHADLNGNGVTSTFEMRGHDSVDERGPVLEPGMYIERETE
jgi:hypothetical protein